MIAVKCRNYTGTLISIEQTVDQMDGQGLYNVIIRLDFNEEITLKFVKPKELTIKIV